MTEDKQASHWQECCSHNAPGYGVPSRAVLVARSLVETARWRIVCAMSCHVVLSLTHKLRTVHEMHMLKAIAFDGPRNQCCDNNSGKPQPIGLDLVHTGKILRSTTFRKFWTRSAKWERNGGAWTILAHPGILSMQNDILATSEQVILTRFGYDT